jgi:hypothetical protein
VTAQELFEFHKDEFGHFERIENKLSNRRDLHAYLMLDRIFPIKKGDEFETIVEWSNCETIDLCLTTEQIETLTSEQVLELVRCGIAYLNCSYKRLVVYD